MKKIYLSPITEVTMLMTDRIMDINVASGETGGGGSGDPSLGPRRKVF